MIYPDAKSQKPLAEFFIDAIRKIPLKREICLMEVCGTHTNAIGKFGIRSVIPDSINLLSGPGCPVCVTHMGYIDKAIEMARIPGVIITTFGDLFRVPGSFSSLQKEKARGSQVKAVYSPTEALKTAAENSDCQVVFLGVGFETTAPVVAACIIRAKAHGITNFSILPGFKTLPPALDALVSIPGLKLNGLVGPGHLSMVTGDGLYQDLLKKAGIGTVITGFEADDILEGIMHLALMAYEEKPQVMIQYSRAVRPEGNVKAISLMNSVFEPADSVWRGLGPIPRSGLQLRQEYESFDALKRFPVNPPPPQEPKGCICGQILTGVKKPFQCGSFATSCTPQNPLGACMVSSEGTCAAYYRYHRK